MAGHSQFKNIMHRKGAQDRRRAKIFTKVARDVTVAVRGGGSDEHTNPHLRETLLRAKEANMPKDIIARAIAKGEGRSKEGAVFEDALYEGFFPGGIGVLVEVNTDNKNRSVSEIRAVFSRQGGSLAETGSVSFLCERQVFMVCTAAPSFSQWDAVIDKALNQEGVLELISIGSAEDKAFRRQEPFSLEDLDETEAGLLLWATPENAQAITKALQALGVKVDSQALWNASVRTPVTEGEKWEDLQKALQKLSDIDDVYGVWHMAEKV